MVSEAAAILGISTSGLRELAREGKIPCRVTDGGHRRFLEADVLVYRGRRAAPDTGTRAAVWTAAATEVLRAAAADLGDTDASHAFLDAAQLLTGQLTSVARSSIRGNCEPGAPGRPGPQ